MSKKYIFEDSKPLNVEEPAAHFQTAYVPDFTNLYHQKSIKGVEKKLVELIMKKLRLSFKEISDLLHISERTFHRYKANDKMDLSVSEKSLQLDELYRHGRSVFDSDEDFAAWLRQPIRALNGEVPLSYLTTSFGFQMIHDELGRIEHGIVF